MQNRRIRFACAFAVLCATAQSSLPAQSAPLEYSGAVRLGLELRRAATSKRVLVIGAHPDDENTALIASLALGQGADVAYLSLTRGDGGQNGIGPELYEGLGIIRTEELLAARRLDGAQQFFTRAFDYGFSKSADEAFRHWPRDTLLANVVEVIRAFRPDVLVPIFSGTPRDGHGQHQASGILAREAFAAAADPARFPEQIAAGLAPFQPTEIYQSLWRPTGQPGPRVQAGDFDPLLGRSYYQMAMASRSRHRSQDMGQLEAAGPRVLELLRVTPNAAGAPASIFAGSDTTLSQRAAKLPSGDAGAAVRAAISTYEEAIQGALRAFNPLRVGETAADAARALAALQHADSVLAGMPAPSAKALRFYVQAERDEVRAVLRDAAGVVLDATTATERIVPGESFEVTLTLWNGGTAPVQVQSLAPGLPDGWRTTPLDADTAELRIGPDVLLTRKFRVDVPTDARPTEAYFVRAPRRGDLYTWPAGTQIGTPFQPPQVQARASVLVGDAPPLPLRTEVVFRTVDKRSGEVRRPLLVVPAIAVDLDRHVAILPRAQGSGAGQVEIRGVVTSHASAPLTGTLDVALPPGWMLTTAPAAASLPGAGARARFDLGVVPPNGVAPGRYPVRIRFDASNGTRYDRGWQIIDYPHISPHALYDEAVVDVQVMDVQVAQGLKVGFVEGAGDDVPEALAQLGVQVELLDSVSLARGDLGAYDAIVTGIRAYEVRPDLAANNARLLRYVQAGGTLVVQYNKYEFVEGSFAPYPLTMASPHDRVTDENAPVRALAPDDPILSQPNRIGEADFEGWVQERGLYFAHTWDPRYRPLLEMSDPGEAPLRGSLLAADYGKGKYVYTGLALFRQLPEGVPGAYRLLANLVSLGAAKHDCPDARSCS